MNGIQFPEQTTVLGAGNNPNTNDLAVVIAKNDSISTDVSFVVSKFKMTPEELQECISNGGEIFLCVMANKASTHNAASLHDTNQSHSITSDTFPLTTSNLNTLMKTGIELIAQERQEQIEKHGRTIAKDDKYNQSQQLAQGAEMLLAIDHEEGIDSESYPDGWDKELCAKMLGKPRKERLIIAGALIAAEIDRLQYDQP